MNNKYSEAIGVFWGASVFIGILSAVIIGINIQNWLLSGIIGLCIFLILGLSIQGIITLIKKQ